MKTVCLALALSATTSTVPISTEDLLQQTAIELVQTQGVLEECIVLAQSTKAVLRAQEVETERLRREIQEEAGYNLQEILVVLALVVGGVGAGIAIGSAL